PDDARLVKRGSWSYFLALARAEFWIDNQGFPDGLRKRPQTTYVQTWHGSAYKLMGLDQPRLKSGPPAERQRLRRMVERYDCFLIRSRHDAETLCAGLGVRSELLPAGYPRNDPLVNGVDGDPELAAEVAALRESLGLDDGRRAVLYAPTFATGPKGRPVRLLAPPVDPAVFERELGEEFVLLVRPHYLCRAGIPPGAHAVMRDAGAVPDVTPLLLLADALVTDHSSIMFDFALLDRPIVLHLPDGRDRVPGYFDLERHAPGPITRTEDELVAALAGLDEAEAVHAPRRRAFAARFGEHDRGPPARTVVDRCFGPAGPHRHRGRKRNGRTACRLRRVQQGRRDGRPAALGAPHGADAGRARRPRHPRRDHERAGAALPRQGRLLRRRGAARRVAAARDGRSEERRVGKEGRSRCR